ncbi:MAG: hypothetical protein M5U28_04585 [Sandaracinaceae bacterium]|nr:hypothetical protein [Sandaracinaceae bacterium]
MRDEGDLAALPSLGFAPTSDAPLQVEEFVRAREHTCETVTIRGEPVWRSGTRYFPGPLEVLETPWIQYCVLLPRESDDPTFTRFHPINAAALSALGIGTALTHMEWFQAGDRLLVNEVGARPPGVHIMPMMGLAHDTDMIRAWAELVTFDRFTPLERRWAAGAAFFRGQGRGAHVRAVHGVEAALAEVGASVVEARFPRPGQPRAEGYEGEGYAIVKTRRPRAPSTRSPLDRARARGALVRSLRAPRGAPRAYDARVARSWIARALDDGDHDDEAPAPLAPSLRVPPVDRRSLYLTMRDGVRIAIDAYVPRGARAAPTILRQTRYLRSLDAPEAIGALFDLYARTRRVFLAAGYAWVDVDVRGRAPRAAAGPARGRPRRCGTAPRSSTGSCASRGRAGGWAPSASPTTAPPPTCSSRRATPRCAPSRRSSRSTTCTPTWRSRAASSSPGSPRSGPPTTPRSIATRSARAWAARCTCSGARAPSRHRRGASSACSGPSRATRRAGSARSRPPSERWCAGCARWTTIAIAACSRRPCGAATTSTSTSARWPSPTAIRRGSRPTTRTTPSISSARTATPRTPPPRAPRSAR